ncbi:MAG TPA: hypothetical protein VFG22_04310 [Polyangiales bacterium]|nr:hypothetical protein [Polyangiales bacterium]
MPKIDASEEAKFIGVGARNEEDSGEYSDIDVRFGPGRCSGAKTGPYLHKDGTPY